MAWADDCYTVKMTRQQARDIAGWVSMQDDDIPDVLSRFVQEILERDLR